MRGTGDGSAERSAVDCVVKKLPKLFLILSAVCFAAGAVSLGLGNIPAAWTVGVPLGAVFLGLFLIALMLQNEMACFDEEERARLASAQRPAESKPGQDPQPAVAGIGRPQVAAAASH